MSFKTPTYLLFGRFIFATCVECISSIYLINIGLHACPILPLTTTTIGVIFLKCGVELTGLPVEFFTAFPGYAFVNEMDMQAILGH